MEITHSAKANAKRAGKADKDLLRYLVLGTEPFGVASLENIKTVYSTDLEYLLGVLLEDEAFGYLYSGQVEPKSDIKDATHAQLLSFLVLVIETGQIIVLDADFTSISEIIADEANELLALI